MKKINTRILKCVMLFLLFNIFLSYTLVSGEEADVVETNKEELEDIANEDPEAAAKAAQLEKKAQEKKKRREELQAVRQQLESCLVLIRASYATKGQYFDNFLKEHPTKDKVTLQSKIMSRMMIKCNKEIQKDTVQEIQKYRVNIPAFKNYLDYYGLIDINWEELKYKPDDKEAEKEKKKAEAATEKAKKASEPVDPDAEEKEQLEDEQEEAEALEEDGEPPEEKKPEDPATPPADIKIEMTQEERIMATEIEDISEDLHAEQVSTNRASAGRTSVAFMDPQNMGTGAKFLYIVFFLSFFGGIGFCFYKGLFPEEQDPRKLRRKQLNERRANETSPSKKRN